ncbi:MAG: putative protein of unknown function cell surface [Solirubrobacteraceae bacterium]|nr:putative protein of unknown function cell surface [Solirubrobacteraceae bacterium]
MFASRRTLLALSLTLLAAPAGAHAATAPVFGVKAVGPTAHGYFALTAAPGATVSGSVRVDNAGHAAGTALILPADATTGRTTGAVYQTTRRSDIGGWLTIDRSQVFLAPGHNAVVHFTARVPADAGAGDHLGGIVVRRATQAAPGARGTAKHSFGVNVVEQAIVAVQVTVAGPASRRLAVTGVRAGANPGYQTLLVGIANGGNRMLKGTGIVKVVNEAGATLRRQAFTIDTFLPRTRVDDPIVLRGATLPAGRYHASVLIRWPGGSSHLHAPFTVSTGQLRQVYGSRGLPGQQGANHAGSGGPGMAVLAGGALLLLLAGVSASALYFRRRTAALTAALRPPHEGDDAIRVRDARPAPEGEAVSADERSGED